MPINNSVESTAERHEIDPVLKEVLTKHLGPLNLTIQTQVEVSRLPRTIDALVILKSPGQRKRVQSETVFRHFRIYNVIEFKGKGDPLTLWKYRLIVGRANLYLGEKKISASKMTVTIISARRPTQVLENCPEDVRWETIGSGHYRSTDLLPVHLFVCDELEIEPKNYPLLLFAASKEKLRQFFERIVEEDNDLYIYYAYFADYDLIEEVLKMAGKQSAYQKTLERMAKDYGPNLLPLMDAETLIEEVLKMAGKQSQYEKALKRLAKDYGPILLSALTPEDLERVLTPEQRVRGLQPEDILRGLDSETLEKLKQLLNGQGKQN